MEMKQNESAAEFAARVQAGYEEMILEVFKKPLLDVTNEDLRLVASQDDDNLMGISLTMDNVTITLLEPTQTVPCQWRARVQNSHVTRNEAGEYVPVLDADTERLVEVLSPAIRGLWWATYRAQMDEIIRTRIGSRTERDARRRAEQAASRGVTAQTAV